MCVRGFASRVVRGLHGERRGVGDRAAVPATSLDAGHFALDTKADEIAVLAGEFMRIQK
jgi:hypothetical protein